MLPNLLVYSTRSVIGESRSNTNSCNFCVFHVITSSVPQVTVARLKFVTLVAQCFQVVANSAPALAYWNDVVCAEFVRRRSRPLASRTPVAVTRDYSRTYRVPILCISLSLSAAYLGDFCYSTHGSCNCLTSSAKSVFNSGLFVARRAFNHLRLFKLGLTTLRKSGIGSCLRSSFKRSRFVLCVNLRLLS